MQGTRNVCWRMFAFPCAGRPGPRVELDSFNSPLTKQCSKLNGSYVDLLADLPGATHTFTFHATPTYCFCDRVFENSVVLDNLMSALGIYCLAEFSVVICSQVFTL